VTGSQQVGYVCYWRSAPLRQWILLLEFVLLIAIDIRIVNRKVEEREQSSWSNTPRGWSKGGDCQRIMHRNKPLTLYRRLTLKRSFNATGLKTCTGGSYVKNLTPKRSFAEGRGVQKTSFLWGRRPLKIHIIPTLNISPKIFQICQNIHTQNILTNSYLSV